MRQQLHKRDSRIAVLRREVPQLRQGDQVRLDPAIQVPRVQVEDAAHRPINTLGLVIHCAVAGVIGLVVMTWLEMRIEPWHFME